MRLFNLYCPWVLKFVEEIQTSSNVPIPCLTMAFSKIQVHSMFNSNQNVLRFLVEGWLLQNDTDVGGPTWTSGGPLGVCICYRNAGPALQLYPQKPLLYSLNQQWPWFAVKIILNSNQGLKISKGRSQQQKCGGQVYFFYWKLIFFLIFKKIQLKCRIPINKITLQQIWKFSLNALTPIRNH